MKTLGLYRGWMALVITFILWGIAFYGITLIERQKSEHATLVSDVQKETTLVAQSSRLHGLLNDTVPERIVLRGILSADVIGLVDAVDAVGKNTGIDLQISNVLPETPKKGPAAGAAVPVTFSVQADGSFAQMTRAIQLLDALPIPGAVQQVELTYAESNWHLSARVRVLTAPEITP